MITRRSSKAHKLPKFKRFYLEFGHALGVWISLPLPETLKMFAVLVKLLGHWICDLKSGPKVVVETLPQRSSNHSWLQIKNNFVIQTAYTLSSILLRSAFLDRVSVDRLSIEDLISLMFCQFALIKVSSSGRRCNEKTKISLVFHSHRRLDSENGLLSHFLRRRKKKQFF